MTAGQYSDPAAIQTDQIEIQPSEFRRQCAVRIRN